MYIKRRLYLCDTTHERHIYDSLYTYAHVGQQTSKGKFNSTLEVDKDTYCCILGHKPL